MDVWTGWVRVGGEKARWVRVVEADDYDAAWKQLLAVKVEGVAAEKFVSRGTTDPDERKKPR